MNGNQMYDQQGIPLYRGMKTNKDIRAGARACAEREPIALFVAGAVAYLPGYVLTYFIFGNFVTSDWVQLLLKSVCSIVYYPVIMGCIACFVSCYRMEERPLRNIGVCLHDKLLWKKTLQLELVYVAIYAGLHAAALGLSALLAANGADVFQESFTGLATIGEAVISLIFLLAPYQLLRDNNCTVREALKRSNRLTSERFGRVVGMYAVFFGFTAAALVIGGLIMYMVMFATGAHEPLGGLRSFLQIAIMLFFVIPYMRASMAGLADELLKQ